jgi:hypothetical protein
MARIFPVIAILVALYVAAGSPMPTPSEPTHPDDPPTPTIKFPAIVAAMTGHREDSQRIAGMCDGLADVIVADGSRKTPKLTYVASILDTWRLAADVLVSGSPTPQHMAFGPAVGKRFQENFPDGSLPLDAGRRQKAVDLFRSLAAELRTVK